MLLDLINEVDKVEEHEINMWKYVAFLYTYNKISEREIKETIPFTIVLGKKKKNLAKNLLKEAKDLFTENDVNERN